MNRAKKTLREIAGGVGVDALPADERVERIPVELAQLRQRRPRRVGILTRRRGDEAPARGGESAVTVRVGGHDGNIPRERRRVSLPGAPLCPLTRN
jgi:hypothetical protein